MIALLLLLILPADIKQATQQHLMALNNISATETIGKDSHRVAMFGGQQAGARPQDARATRATVTRSADVNVLEDTLPRRLNRDGVER